MKHVKSAKNEIPSCVTLPSIWNRERNTWEKLDRNVNCQEKPLGNQSRLSNDRSLPITLKLRTSTLKTIGNMRNCQRCDGDQTDKLEDKHAKQNDKENLKHTAWNEDYYVSEAANKDLALDGLSSNGEKLSCATRTNNILNVHPFFKSLSKKEKPSKINAVPVDQGSTGHALSDLSLNDDKQAVHASTTSQLNSAIHPLFLRQHMPLNSDRFEISRYNTNLAIECKGAPWPLLQHILPNTMQISFPKSRNHAYRRSSPKRKYKQLLHSAWSRPLPVLSNLGNQLKKPKRIIMTNVEYEAVLDARRSELPNLDTTAFAKKRALYTSDTWPQKYQPRTIDEVLVDTEVKVQLKTWLTTSFNSLQTRVVNYPSKKRKLQSTQDSKFHSDDSLQDFIVNNASDNESIATEETDRRRAVTDAGLVLTGKLGSNKTAAIYALANDLGCQIAEINSGSRRGGKDLLDRVGELSQTHRLPKMKKTQQEPCNRTLILLKDVDIMFDQDKGFWNSALYLLEQSRWPIVMTCEDTHLLPDEIKKCETIVFNQLSQDDMVSYLSLIAFIENHILSLSDLQKLCSAKNGNIRACLMTLQFWCQASVGDPKFGMDWTYVPYHDISAIHILAEKAFESDLQYGQRTDTDCADLLCLSDNPYSLDKVLLQHVSKKNATDSLLALEKYLDDLSYAAAYLDGQPSQYLEKSEYASSDSNLVCEYYDCGTLLQPHFLSLEFAIYPYFVLDSQAVYARKVKTSFITRNDTIDSLFETRPAKNLSRDQIECIFGEVLYQQQAASTIRYTSFLSRNTIFTATFLLPFIREMARHDLNRMREIEPEACLENIGQSNALSTSTNSAQRTTRSKSKLEKSSWRALPNVEPKDVVALWDVDLDYMDLFN